MHLFHALTTGSRLGAYEIISPLGTGGMGEVYRARDTRLKREVAIKVLPEGFSKDADRLARFQREAEVLATLNHPNIAAVYGLEKDGGITGIVLELVDGETLADLITRGPLAVSDALPIARQIADALETAHDKGVVHRDLKPANIKVTPEGKVKVLDFGLAKMLEPEPAASSLSMSPTFSALPTYAGTILGTAAYMSPEQARGKAVDRRTDIWAFGCVLFEMLTGKQAFEGGETVSDAIAAILRGEVDWNASAQFALSATGTLVYLVGQSAGNDAPILWMGRDGKTTPLRAAPADWTNPHFAPDGRRLAMDIGDGTQADVWIYEWARDTLTRLTFDPTIDFKPVWTPDGRRIVFASLRDKATPNLYWQRADGTGEVQRLTESKNVQYPASWHPSSKYLAFQEQNPQNAFDIMILPMEGDEASGWKPGKPAVFLNSPALEAEPMFLGKGGVDAPSKKHPRSFERRGRGGSFKLQNNSLERTTPKL